MEKAHLFCPREMVFTRDRIEFLPVVPNINTKLSGSMLEIEVNILGIEGDQALVLLPELLRKDEQYIATVGIQHLN
jgi:hypothetical protein